MADYRFAAVISDCFRMSNPNLGTTLRVQQGLDRLAQGDLAARDDLLQHSGRRLRLLATSLFREFRNRRDLQELDDFIQQSMLRLWKTLQELRPRTSQHFFRLAAKQMRWALLDLVRRNKRFRGDPDGRTVSGPIDEPFDTTHIPDRLLFWTDFHAAVDRLPEPERTVVDLVWYHGASRAEVAAVLDVSTRQVQHYWQSARRQLKRLLADHFPG